MGRFSVWTGELMQHSEPHLTWNEQLTLLKSRGMVVSDDADAVRDLQRIGYYRFSIYSHVFLAPEPNTRTSANPSQNLLRQEFRVGTRFVDVVALHDFDSRPRIATLMGIQKLEICARARISYRLGATSPVGHLDRSALNREACLHPVRGGGSTSYDAWRSEYDKLQHQARNEGSVRHFTARRPGVVPIEAACEFLTLGSLIWLFQLMLSADRRRIANDFGVKDPQIFEGWLRALNVTRNHCAHNARIWNRKTIYPPDHINTRMVRDSLHHLRACDSNRLYFLVALIAYLLRQTNPDTEWPRTFIEIMKSFPEGTGLDFPRSSGFPSGWSRLPLWSP